MVFYNRLGAIPMKYRKQQEMLASKGWVEEGIALWAHNMYPAFYLDANAGSIIVKRFGHWFEGDNFYGIINNENDLRRWMRENI